jgi:hypothetical protein
MLSFKQFTESFGYSTGTWRYYVEKDGKMLEPKVFYEKKHEADKKAAEVGGKVRKVRY